MDDQISTFCAFTSATPEHAQQFLQLTDGNVEHAVQLFFNNPDLGSHPPSAAQSSRQSNNQDTPIVIDDDDELEIDSGNLAAEHGHIVDDDEAMARRLQEEMYASGTGAAIAEDVRAPMARTTETLVGPGSHDWREEEGGMNAAITQQLLDRRRRRAAPGIFNQRETPSIWANDDPNDARVHREVLSRATGGASDQTSKSNLLADLFRPPFDLLSPLRFSEARDEGKEAEKWIIINVQDPSIFDCQVLNRDIWKNASIRDTVKENFIFLQYNKDDARAEEYVNYYMGVMRDSEDAYPHIAIVDPRTGEQVKTWSGAPAPKAPEFIMELHEFLDRYSLKMEKKNPVQTKRRETRKDVSQMSEEEMLEMAMHQSLANGSGPKAEDPDALTKSSHTVTGKGKSPAHAADLSGSSAPATASAAEGSDVDKDTPFARITSSRPHEEPSTADASQSTRIQFRYSGGRIVRRFLLSDPVQRIYEWLKAAPIEGKDGASFELINMGRNLIDILDSTIGDAGLRNGTVMVEFIDGE